MACTNQNIALLDYELQSFKKCIETTGTFFRSAIGITHSFIDSNRYDDELDQI